MATLAMLTAEEHVGCGGDVAQEAHTRWDEITEMVPAMLETMTTAATQWSTQSMAKASLLSVSSVYRIWQAFSPQPHRNETFRLSIDPLFIDKVRDIVGLHHDPPDRALELCIEESRRSGHWIALSRCCPCALGKSSGVRTTTNDMGQRRCSPRWTCRLEPVSASACRSTGHRSSAGPSTPSSRMSPLTSTFTS
jgi:hypothetical protein